MGKVILGGQPGWSVYRLATGEIVSWGLNVAQPATVPAGCAAIQGHWPGEHFVVANGQPVRR